MKYNFQLVVTCALKQELPLFWIKENGYPVFNLKALESGILKTITFSISQKGILFVITGVGKENSIKSAQWIIKNLKPLFVINTGSTAATDTKIPAGSGIIPSKIRNTVDNDCIYHDNLVPFPLPDELLLSTSVILTSSLKPVTTQKTKGSCSYFYDMEAYWQAKAFMKTAISFHCLKFVSDYASSSTQKDYFTHLKIIRNRVQQSLSLLKSNSRADISVIVPLFNRELHAGRCIQSILNQTLKPEEIIVINDGSTDKSLEVLESFSGQIKIINLKKTHGVSYARNKGIKSAKSTWLAFLDSDDEWTSEKLHNQWSYIQKNPFYEVIQSEEVWIRNGIRVNACKHHQKKQGWIWENCLNRCLISPSGILIKKSIFDQFGLFDETLPACEDYDMWLRISRKKVIGLEPGYSIIKYGGHADQLSKKYPAMDQFRVKSLLKALKEETSLIHTEKIKDILKTKLSILIQGCKKRGKVKEAFSYNRILDDLLNYKP
ncbi:MAG: glycosyltransferase [bacterium]|nr:glycosyltransferase [bacterium]